MQRSRLRNIINMSKKLQHTEDPYDVFVKSLPVELDYYKDGGKYRLKAAWESYGKPKDLYEAQWNGLVESLNGKFVMPSIGYNEYTDEYEYLNKGKENETVNKDIRVWDNDVIPLVKELKQGGFIRIYDEEKDCWKYSKNQSQDVESFKSGGKKKIKVYLEGDCKEGEYIEVESLNEDQRLGRVPIGKDSKGRNRYLNGDNKAVLNQGGRQDGDIPGFQKGGKSPKKEKNDQTYAEFIATLPLNLQKGNDGENGYRMRYAFDNSPDVWTFDDAKGKFINWNEKISLGMVLVFLNLRENF